MNFNVQNIDSRFYKIGSSDESDSDDDTLKKILRNDDSDCEQDDNSVSVQNGLAQSVKPSKRLEIVGQRKNANKKFSIWSEILLEEELSESMDNACKLKTRSRKRKKADVEKESDNYFSWTKEDFERKFGTRTDGSVAKRQKKEPASEIANQLGESRVDIIKRIIEVLGEELTRRLAAEVMDIESVGGMMTNDGTRKRSPGGLFFYLVKNDPAINNEQKAAIFCDTVVKLRNKEVKKSKRIKKTSSKSKKKNKKNKKNKKKK